MVDAKVRVDEIIEFIKKADQRTLSDLVEEIKKQFGVSEGVIMGSATSDSGEKPQAKKEASKFNIRLKSVGTNRVRVYGIVMKAFNASNASKINIIEAKKKAEEAAEKNENILTNLSNEEVENIQTELNDAKAEFSVEEA